MGSRRGTGVAGFYYQHPIKVARDEPVRAYVVNMLEYEPVGSFHLHAQTFDVYPAGMGAHPAFREDTIALAQGQRAIVEFRLPDSGRHGEPTLPSPASALAGRSGCDGVVRRNLRLALVRAWSPCRQL